MEKISHESLGLLSDQFGSHFKPETCILSGPKTSAQRLENFKMVFAQYDDMVMHISGERSCWGDVLSRWVNVPAVAVRAGAVFASSAPDEAMPSNGSVREAQQQAKAGVGAMVSDASLFTTPVGRGTKDNEDLLRAGPDSRDVKVNWVEFDEGESSWELLSNIYMGRRPVVCQVGAVEVEA